MGTGVPALVSGWTPMFHAPGISTTVYRRSHDVTIQRYSGSLTKESLIPSRKKGNPVSACIELEATKPTQVASEPTLFLSHTVVINISATASLLPRVLQPRFRLSTKEANSLIRTGTHPIGAYLAIPQLLTLPTMTGRVTRSRQSVDGAAAPSTVKTETANTSRKRTAPVKQEDEPEQIATPIKRPAKKAKTSKPKSDLDDVPVKQEGDPEQKASPAKQPAKKPKTGKARPDFHEAARVAAKIQADPNGTKLATSSPSKSKTNAYNLTPGASPYPSYARPTPEECQNVNDLLAAVHGNVKAPKTIPAPNLQSSGCGEVPSVLDALVRTRLSAATNNANSSRAFRGLVEKFGIIKEGVGKGSVDWDKVRQAPQQEVFEAIKTGGLADVKSRDIQKILNMVYEENQASHGEHKPARGKVVLSLDHLHAMESEAAFDKLVGYPGVGPKTASCVLLFCMQRPSFAVDTHVFRLVSWLGWVPGESGVRRMAKDAKANGEKPPPPVSRNTSYAHLDVRIPDELKYPLHYLFIRHGKTCPYCAAKKDGKIRRDWGDKKCPLAALKKGKDVATAMKVAEEAETEIKEETLSEESS